MPTSVTRRHRPIAVAALLALMLPALCVAGAGTASAHATLIASDPADNAVLTEAPQRVTATFNEGMQGEFAAMTVIGPDGDQWGSGETRVDGAAVSVALRPLGPPGTYTVNYRATSADAHVVTGSWSFQLTVGGATTEAPAVTPTSPATPATPAAQPAAAGDDPPVWPFVALAALIVAAGAWWQLHRRG